MALCPLPQAEWREEVKLHFEKIKSEGTCLHRLEEELIHRRREELRSVGYGSILNDTVEKIPAMNGVQGCTSSMHPL